MPIRCDASYSAIPYSVFYKLPKLHAFDSDRPLAVGTILRNGTERNGTERNDGLNCGTECFLRLKLAAYHCCTSYQWHFQQVIKRTPRKIKRI